MRPGCKLLSFSGVLNAARKGPVRSRRRQESWWAELRQHSPCSLKAGPFPLLGSEVCRIGKKDSGGVDKAGKSWGLGGHISYWQYRVLSNSPMSIGENFTLSFWVFPTGTKPEEGSTEKGEGHWSVQWSKALSRVLPVPWLSWSFWLEPEGRWRKGDNLQWQWAAAHSQALRDLLWYLWTQLL